MLDVVNAVNTRRGDDLTHSILALHVYEDCHGSLNYYKYVMCDSKC
jgi:hypothetical protein